MATVGYLFTTKIYSERYSLIESVSDFFLKPAQYLWNGMKVDWIQQGNSKACHIGLIYKPNQKNYLTTVLMIILLIPGVLIGGILKFYAYFRYHNIDDDKFIQKCLKAGNVKLTYVQRGDRAFGEKLLELIEILKQATDVACIEENDPLFLSEITNVKLRYDHFYRGYHGMFGSFSKEKEEENKKYNSKAFNRKILDNIDLLWNITHLDVANHYAERYFGREREILLRLNPSITYPISDFSSWSTEARSFFNLFPSVEDVTEKEATN